MDEQQLKLTTVLTSVLNQTLVLNDKQKATIINYVKEEGNDQNINTQICIKCMKVALLLWEHEVPTKEPLIFFLDILIEFCKNKSTFVVLHHNNIFKRIIYVFQTIDYTKDCDIYRRYIKLLDVFTHSGCGRNWLVNSWECWKNVFNVIGTQKYTEDLSVLLTDLFLSVVDTSELFSLELSKLILQPLTTVCVNISENKLIGIFEVDLYYDIIPKLNLLSSVIMCISKKVTLDNQWLTHCSKLLEFEKPLTLLLETLEEKELFHEVSKLLAGLHFLDIAYNSNHPKFIKLFFEKTIKMMDLNITRQFVDNIIISAYHLQHYWYHIRRLFDISRVNVPYNYDEFICLYQILPMMGMSRRIFGNEICQIVKEDVLRDNHIGDLIEKFGEAMLNQRVQMQKYIFADDSFLSVTNLALDHISKSFCLHNKECRIIIFNALIYFLGDIIIDIHKNKNIKSQLYDDSVVTHFINTFVFYGGKCEVTWKEVTTHMLVLVTAIDLLQVQNIPSNVIVASLKMLDLAIAKRMAPDLTLLVDCNSLNSIGSLLESKLSCGNAEVRSAASKVLVTISESAKSNYPFFEKILLDSDIPQQLLTRVLNKEVLEVRSNALKCLQHLVRISSIWDVISSFLDILDSMINLLRTETENLLKAELINLVVVIYEEDYFNDLQVNELYDIMTYLGTNDCDVTIRINCLKFWNAVIKKLQIEEGMVDGEFPEVTFSKESRKIIVLNEDQIKQRLKRLMKKLSEIGGLTVLNYCFSTKEKEEKHYVDEIVYDLLVILKTHHIDENNVNLSSSESPKSNFNFCRFDDLVLEIVGSREFLENVTQAPADYCVENSRERKFYKFLDELLRCNNLDFE